MVLAPCITGILKQRQNVYFFALSKPKFRHRSLLNFIARDRVQTTFYESRWIQIHLASIFSMRISAFWDLNPAESTPSLKSLFEFGLEWESEFGFVHLWSRCERGGAPSFHSHLCVWTCDHHGIRTNPHKITAILTRKCIHLLDLVNGIAWSYDLRKWHSSHFQHWSMIGPISLP